MAHFTAPRLTGFDYTGRHQYSLTICTHDRESHFISTAAVACVHAQLVRTASAGGVSVVAYCYMPDHLHLLVQGNHEDADVRAWVQLFKQCSAYSWKRQFGVALWQRSYYDHVLRKDEDCAVVARYILMNPVRQGLCRSPRQYPYLGSLSLDVSSLLDAAQTLDLEGRT